MKATRVLNRYIVCIISVVIAVGFASRYAHAVDVYSTFGFADIYDTLNGAEIEGIGGEFPYAQAERFSPSESYFLDSIDLALSAVTPNPSVRVELYTDESGVPGTLLESANLTTFSNGIVTANLSGGTILTGGVNYWISLFAEGADIVRWNDSLSAVNPLQAFTENDGATWTPDNSFTFPSSAFRIEGTEPEPPELSFITPGNVWNYFPGLEEPSLGTAWTTSSFDDSAWNFDVGGFGYDDNVATQAGLLSAVATPLPGMRDNGVNADAHTSLYLRREFTVVDPLDMTELILQLDYDDAFVAYINGVEIARSNFGTIGTPEPFDAIGSEHESTNGSMGQSLERFVIDLVNDFPGLLSTDGSNYLSIQGLNSSLDDDDFVIAQISLGGNSFASNLPGDFNGDLVVDAADYTVWRDNLGVTENGSVLSGNGNGGIVDATDYALWYDNYGTSFTQLAVSVPEPTSSLLGVSLGLSTLLLRKREVPIVVDKYDLRVSKFN